jgi:ParB family chromosome partitioning protein
MTEDFDLDLATRFLKDLEKVALNPIEVAHAFASLMKQFRFTQADLAEKIGKKRSTIANYLRLLSLPKEIQKNVAKGILSVGHAKVILSLPTAREQLILQESILKNHLTVKESESFVQNPSTQHLPLRKKSKEIHVSHLESILQQKLGTTVSIHGSGKKGSIRINFDNLDELDNILAFLGINNS